MDGLVIGRDAVLADGWQALVGCGAVLIDGPAGIGKTVVWRELVTRAQRAGWLVLSCAPAESESTLPLAALADVLRPLAGTFADLPPPQRAAVEMVLLSSSAGGPLEERALGAAVRSLLDMAVDRDARVLVAVDDAPWLDPPSERALRFALRRVAGRVAILVAQRTSEAGSAVPPLDLGRFPADRLVRLELGPLGVGALHHVLRHQLKATLSRPLLARIIREAGGNPLLTIELARAVLRLPRLPASGEDLPAAASMHDLIEARLASLPETTRDAIRVAALLTVPRLADLAAVGVSQAAFDAAEEAGLLAVTDAGVVQFAHPLYASTVRAGIPPGVRRRLHRRLADVVADPDERARQLARCTVEPDASVAHELDAAAQRQRSRGAPEIAAMLYERAAELSRTDGDRGRRRVLAVRCRYDSGDYQAAAAMADAVISEFTGEYRAEALMVRAMVHWTVDENEHSAVAAAEQALAAAGTSTLLAGRAHAYLSLFADNQLEVARRHAETACTLLAGSEPDRDLLAGSMLQLFLHEVRLGHPPRTELLEEALVVEGGEPTWFAGTVPAIWWAHTDDHHRARRRLSASLASAVARGDEPTQHELHNHLAQVELLAGRYAAAERHLASARELGEQLNADPGGERLRGAYLDTYRGELAAAGRVAEAGLRIADELNSLWYRRGHLLLAGLVALSAGRPADAAAAYGEFATLVDGLGMVEPLGYRFEPDWIEASVSIGDLDTARAVLERLAVRHARLPRPWTTLGLARSRVLIDGAAGCDPLAALDELCAAREAVAPDVVPLERARCLLVAGAAHRRNRRKRAAREALTRAVAEFEALGAVVFAARARDELARVGVRPPAPLDLTATEEKVARLAAQGQTNRDIADTLFISPKTVEGNLARAYRKLGISKRAQLSAALAGRRGPLNK